jgi:hypothetical protein
MEWLLPSRKRKNPFFSKYLIKSRRFTDIQLDICGHLFDKGASFGNLFFLLFIGKYHLSKCILKHSAAIFYGFSLCDSFRPFHKLSHIAGFDFGIFAVYVDIIGSLLPLIKNIISSLHSYKKVKVQIKSLFLARYSLAANPFDTPDLNTYPYIEILRGESG